MGNTVDGQGKAPASHSDLSSASRQGIEFFNSQSFFDAHEALEDVWREAREPEKRFLQGLIQAAVAFHHYKNGNIVGARSLLERSIEKLGEYPADYGGILVGELVIALREWQAPLGAHAAVPAFPRIKLAH